MSDTEKLLPCPFCGGKADIYVEGKIILDRYKKCYSVYCKDCCCTTQYEENKQDAIKDWNKRI